MAVKIKSIPGKIVDVFENVRLIAEFYSGIVGSPNRIQIQIGVYERSLEQHHIVMETKPEEPPAAFAITSINYSELLDGSGVDKAFNKLRDDLSNSGWTLKEETKEKLLRRILEKYIPRERTIPD